MNCANAAIEPRVNKMVGWWFDVCYSTHHSRQAAIRPVLQRVSSLALTNGERRLQYYTGVYILHRCCDWVDWHADGSRPM